MEVKGKLTIIVENNMKITISNKSIMISKFKGNKSIVLNFSRSYLVAKIINTNSDSPSH